MTDKVLRILFICECPIQRSYNEVKKFKIEVTDGALESKFRVVQNDNHCQRIEA